VTQACTVEGCDRKFYGRGYCVKHYKRWRAHGDPTGGGTDWGAAKQFIKDAAKSGGDECITFPFYRGETGYGWMRAEGKNLGAHVYVALLAHGPKPTPKHQACHTCGKGHEGCVNPRHIYWGTKGDNMRDAYRHGVAFGGKYGRTGEEAPGCRYSDDQIQEVRRALDMGEKQTAIASRFGLSQSHVSRIKNGTRNQPSPAAPHP